VFRHELRRCVIFGRLDLVQDAAISRLDLLVCRNTLMYFNAEVQQRILARFHFALNRHGYLFLGRAETLLTHSDLFRPVDLRHRMFSRSASSDVRDRLAALNLASQVSAAEAERPTQRPRLLEVTLEAAPVAQIAVDRAGFLTLANERARELFGLKPSDLGRLVQDLEVSYRPVELRSLIDAVYRSHEPLVLDDVEWHALQGEVRHVEVQVVPLADATGNAIGAAVFYTDHTQARMLSAELEPTSQRLATA